MRNLCDFMNKLNEKNKQRLKKIIQSANSIGIESLIIDSESIRGTGESNSIILIDKNTLDDISTIGDIGVSRVSVLNSRLSLMKNDDYSINFTQRIKDNGDPVLEKFIIKNGRTSIDFKCADPKTIISKKSLTSSIVYSFDLSQDSVDLIIKSNSAMQNDTISFLYSENKVTFKLSDTSGDILTHIISSDIKVDDDSDSFFFNYNKKIILPLLKIAVKDDDKVRLSFTKKGIMNLNVNDLNIYLAPEIL